MRWSAIPLFAVTAILTACSGTDRKPLPKQNDLFLLFTISGDQETGMVNGIGQFRSGGPNGPAVALDDGQILLDGQPLRADSARLSGVFYHLEVPAARFEGKHQVVVERRGESEGQVNFRFTPFRMEETPRLSGKDGLRVQLSGMEQGRVMISLVDTAYATNDFLEKIALSGGELRISGQALKNIKPGPVFMELTTESETPFSFSSIRGKIIVRWGLSAETILNK